ncbi:uncharacterized protein LOC113674694 [Pocillopora damicornis]|uniref:uncharacterized protein LOC113674694 n=1 Tax=Pocillopora damicornis TaxID=46731 RepID=UPI000F550E6E|nr:uncharacterized protein LOC113674694 [Pocillopora damicornis]
MVYEVLFVAFTFIGINTSSSLSGSYPKLSSPSCKKCPAGSFTVCSLNEESRCVKCAEGTYNDKPSRRGTCKRCTRCGHNEYKSHPCNSTSNTVCVKCRECPPGFGVFRPCEKTRDTDCVKCPVPESFLSSYGKVECGIKVDSFRNNIREKEKLKDSFFVLREEVNPWENGRKNPKSQHRLAFVEKHVNANIFVSALPSVNPTPSSVFFSTKPTSAVDQGTILVSFAFYSSPSSSRSVEKSITFPAGEIIDPTLRPDIPSKRRPPSRPTEKSVSSFKTPTNFEIQGDDGSYPSRTPRNTRQNGTDATTTRVASPVSPSKSVKAMYINHRMDEELSTESYRHRTNRWSLANVLQASVCSGLVERRETLVVLSVQFLRACSEVMLNAELKVIAEFLSNFYQHTLLPLQNNLVVADVHHISQSDGTDSRSPGYITEAEATFDSSGGQLIAPDSDVVITVGSGAVQEGIKRRFFFRVLKDDSTLLQDIPDVPEGTLISPVIECGPHGVTLLKPVEISVPHDLCLDEVRKDLIRVYRWEPSSKGPPQWEKIPSASEKNCQSKAWFTVKKNSILIKTKKFSIWSVFACGGTKRKRATVYFSRHNPRSDHIYLRFYIYSDNEDSKKRVKAQEKESFPGSRSSKEKPFKMYDNEKDVIVKLTDLEDGWELDKTPSLQKYNYDTAYRNGFRAKDACDFAVRPARPGVKEFSCNLKFNQEDSPTEYSIYLYPGYSPRQTGRNIFVQNSESGTFSNGRKVAGAVSITMPPEENEINGSQETITSMDSSANQTESFSYDISSLGSDRQPVTEDHFHCIREEIGAKWKNVLRKLGLREPEIENICVNHKEYGVEESFFQGLLKWKKRFGEEATTEKLCDVLREARCTEALKKFRELSCRV